jgi:hypothetical protein
VKSSWVKGLEPDQAKQVGDAYDASALLRERLAVLLNEKYDVCEKSSVSKDGYDSPNWAFKKADEVGYKRAILEILKII